MIVELADVEHGIRKPQYCGLRMTADEYEALPEDGFRYELVDGVVVMSPGASYRHQSISLRIASVILQWLDEHPIGQVFENVDVYFGRGPRGGDLVYRPDILFLRSDQVAPRMTRFEGAPPLAVEIISESSKRYDRETKMGDYERCGVDEFWLIDPERKEMQFYRLVQGRYEEIAPSGGIFRSQVLLGFELDLEHLRASFED